MQTRAAERRLQLSRQPYIWREGIIESTEPEDMHDGVAIGHDWTVIY